METSVLCVLLTRSTSHLIHPLLDVCPVTVRESPPPALLTLESTLL